MFHEQLINHLCTSSQTLAERGFQFSINTTVDGITIIVVLQCKAFSEINMSHERLTNMTETDVIYFMDEQFSKLKSQYEEWTAYDD